MTIYYCTLLINIDSLINFCCVNYLFPVIAGRAKPQQPCEQSGRAALSGKQEGVREEGDGHCGAELGGRLSFPRSLLLLLHHPLVILPVLQPLIFTSSREKKKTATIIRRSATLKKRRNKEGPENNRNTADI